MTEPFVGQDVQGFDRTRHGTIDSYLAGGDRRLHVFTDRSRDFLSVKGNPIPGKGRIGQQLTRFWVKRLGVPHAALSWDLEEMFDRFELSDKFFWPEYENRSVLCRTADMIPADLYVHGYLTGQAWEHYSRAGEIGVRKVKAGLQQGTPLPEPVCGFYAKDGVFSVAHSLPPALVGRRIGEEKVYQIYDLATEMFQAAAVHLWHAGYILAEAKLNWGLIDGEPVVCGQVFTPETAKIWPLHTYRLERNVPGFDTQLVADWLKDSGWAASHVIPKLPEGVVSGVRGRLVNFYKELVGEPAIM